MTIDLPLTKIFFSLLLLIAASSAGVLARYLAWRVFGWAVDNWKNVWVMLFFFGLVILFVKVS